MFEQSTVALAQMDPVIWTVGERIRKAREDRDWKQSDLADELQVDRSTIGGWETNAHRPNFMALRAIAEVTGKPTWWLAGYDSPPDEGIPRLADRRSRRGREQGIRASRCFRDLARHTGYDLELAA